MQRTLRAWTGSPWTHVALMLATACTATLAGALSWEGAAAHLLDVVRSPSLLARGVPYAVLLLAILGAHEMGHYVACRRHRIPASLPYFLPGIPMFGTFGALIRIRGPIPDRNALFDVAAAGPLAGFVVALPVLLAGLARGEPVPAGLPDGSLEFGSPLVSLVVERALYGSDDVRIDSVYGAAWVGMLVTSLNLFPVGQLDGGHAAYAVSRRLHRVLAWSTPPLLAALVLYQALAQGVIPAYALWVVVLAVLRDRHPRLIDERTPLSRGRSIVAILLALLFVATFVPLPLRLRWAEL